MAIRAKWQKCPDNIHNHISFKWALIGAIHFIAVAAFFFLSLFLLIFVGYSIIGWLQLLYASYYYKICLFIVCSFADALRIVKDRKYGAKNADEVGGWDGMVGELVRRVCIFLLLYFIQLKKNTHTLTSNNILYIVIITFRYKLIRIKIRKSITSDHNWKRIVGIFRCQIVGICILFISHRTL